MHCSEFHEWQIHLNRKHGASYCPYSLVPDPKNFQFFFEAFTVRGWVLAWRNTTEKFATALLVLKLKSFLSTQHNGFCDASRTSTQESGVAPKGLAVRGRRRGGEEGLMEGKKEELEERSSLSSGILRWTTGEESTLAVYAQIARWKRWCWWVLSQESVFVCVCAEYHTINFDAAETRLWPWKIVLCLWLWVSMLPLWLYLSVSCLPLSLCLPGHAICSDAEMSHPSRIADDTHISR